MNYGDETVVFLEIDQPFCAHTYGVSPCIAALSAVTTDKCYNSRFTCQDPANYSPGILTLSFARPQDGLLKNYAGTIPSILSVSTSPTSINLGGMDVSQSGLGQRESVTLMLSDHSHSDLGVDKYRLDRATGVANFTGIKFDPYQQGTFWGKWLARNPYYNFYRARIRTGTMGQALSAMQVRNYVVNNISVQTDGSVQITLKDVFSLIDPTKSVAPLVNTGRLNADITNVATSLTLTAPGVGDLEYPLSGYVCIGSEVIGFVRSAGSDNLTSLTRAQFGSTAAAHKQEDFVQLCLLYTAELAHDIVYDLFTNYSDVDPSDIVKADWDAAASGLVHLYSTVITAPTPVQDLVGELAIQAGFTIWPDTISGLITLVALVPTAPSETVTDNGWIVDGSLSLKRQDQMRASEIWVYYGQLDPTLSMSDPNSFHSCAVSTDLASEGDQEYGTAMVRQVFSRWIPQFGRTVALEVGARLLTMFRDPPMQATFNLHANKAGELNLAEVFILQTGRIQTPLGLPDMSSYIPIQIGDDSAKDQVMVLSQEVVFFTPTPSTARTIFIDNDSLNLNFRTIHDSLYPAPTGVETVVFIVSSGVNIGSSSPSAYAADTGTWPAGVALSLQNLGFIQACGGLGGTGADLSNGTAAGVGGTGGDALHVQYPISIDDSAGHIWAGAGGGGGGGFGIDGVTFTLQGGGGGGGGAGDDGGSGGAGGSVTVSAVGTVGNAGTPTAGGTGGPGGAFGNGVGGTGGTGGAIASVGGVGSAGTFGGGVAGAGGAGGAAGRYIVGNSLVTWTAHGDELGGVA